MSHLLTVFIEHSIRLSGENTHILDLMVRLMKSRGLLMRMVSVLKVGIYCKLTWNTFYKYKKLQSYKVVVDDK